MKTRGYKTIHTLTKRIKDRTTGNDNNNNNNNNNSINNNKIVIIIILIINLIIRKEKRSPKALKLNRLKSSNK